MTCVGPSGRDKCAHRQAFSVRYEYDVHFTRRAFAPDNPVLASTLAGRALFVVDRGLCGHGLGEAIPRYAAAHRIELAAPPEVVAGGEAVKQDPAVVERLQRRLRASGIDRHSTVVAVGGGALLDVVGWVAATVHRGVRLVRLPSTVLAQADSGVGVKNGINALGQKNFLGTFMPPHAVVNDLDLLASLGERDRRAGMAEAVKVALIRDAGFFAWLEQAAGALRAFDSAAVEHLVRRCAELHMRHIAEGGDPFERGSARPLDFGHWAAHKLEMLSRHALRHGEAVAIGVALDSRYSVESGLLPAAAADRILRLLRALGFVPWHPAIEDDRLLDGLREFREHLGGELTVTLLEGIGRGREVHAIDAAAMRRAAAWLREAVA